MNQFLIALLVSCCALPMAEADQAMLPFEQTEALNAEGMKHLESATDQQDEDYARKLSINTLRRLALREIVAKKDVSWLPRLVQIIDQTHARQRPMFHESQESPVINALVAFGADAIEPIIAELKTSPPARKQRLLNYALQQILGPDETTRLLVSRSITLKLDDAIETEKIPTGYRHDMEKQPRP